MTATFSAPCGSSEVSENGAPCVCPPIWVRAVYNDSLTAVDNAFFRMHDFPAGEPVHPARAWAVGDREGHIRDAVTRS